ncbi:MAG: alpha/beta hydrolase [Thalassovita sp.]
MKILPMLIATSAIAIAASPMQAQEIDGSKFRSLDEGSWYHPVEPEQWSYYGADENEVYGVLSRIENAKGARSNADWPDTITAYGPGNWVYEFSQVGEAALKAGNYGAAINYFHTAAAPHAGLNEQNVALEKARDAYKMAMKDIGHYEEIEVAFEGETFTVHLHIPEGDGPFPVLVMSNGSDMSSVAALSYYEKHLQPKGIAFLTLDVPGMGRSSAYDMSDGRTEKLHVAAINWAKNDARLDPQNVFMQGISFSGHSAARIFAFHEDLDLGGIVYTCGPLHSAFLAPAHVYEDFPKFTIDGVKTRMGLSLDTSFKDFADAIRVLALGKHGAFEGPMIDTPILALNLNDDPSAPLDEMDELLARATAADRVVFDMPGHCPPHNHREPVVASWIAENLR